MGRTQEERKREHYYRAAKKHGYRSRSAYKLKEVIAKYRLLSGVNCVLELCTVQADGHRFCAKSIPLSQS